MEVDTGIIIVMAYPETIVMVAEEWYSPLLKYIGVGTKNYVRAGHAALVLIHKETGQLEYHDFGRYITTRPYGRVRGANYDRELAFPLKANIENGVISNLNEILTFLATNPDLTHGEGKLIASVCHRVDYDKAKSHIKKMQERERLRYAAFIKDATNCARFVTDALIAGVTDARIRYRLKRSQWFTPSTVGNVVIANTGEEVFEADCNGVRVFTATVFSINKKYLFDRLKDYKHSFIGNIRPKRIHGMHGNAQWLGGIAAGAWYEITSHEQLNAGEFRLRRFAPNGRLDIDAVFNNKDGFTSREQFKVIHYSNCLYCRVLQHDEEYILNYNRDFIV